MSISMFLNKKWLILDSVGFDSIGDFFSNVFMTKGILIGSATLMAILGIIDQFVAAQIYDPAKGIYILFFTTLFDVTLGVSVSIHQKDGFDSYKFGRAFARFATQVVFVAILHQSNLIWPIVADWIVSTLLFAFILSTLWSAFKNAHKLKWVQESTFLMIEKLLSIQNLFEIIVNKVMKDQKDKKK